MKKRVLITGGGGFIGSHLVGRLLQKGDDVTVIDDLSTGKWENVEKYASFPGYKYAIASIQNEAVLDRLVSEVDVVVHLAAAVGVQLVVERPVATIETNVIGTECVLRTALRYRAKVLVASTSEVYGKGNGIPFREDDDVLLGPTSRSRWGYAASKMVDEFLSLAYHREYGLPVVVVRLFNTVGPGQSGEYGMVVPRFVESAMRGEPLVVFGDGTQRRCFCDVRDVVRALELLISSKEGVGHVFNVGSNAELGITELAEMVREVCQSESAISYLSYDKAYAPGFEDMMRRVPSINKIHDLCGWRPEIDMQNTITDVRDSMRRHLDI